MASLLQRTCATEKRTTLLNEVEESGPDITSGPLDFIIICYHRKDAL